MSATYDVIVLGVGGFGSATLAQLAQRGLKVLGLDRFGIAHGRGSSHGETRIIRKAYFEHPDYVPLLQRSYELIRELEADTGASVYDECGLFLAGPNDGEAVSGARKSARLHGLTIEDISLADARGRFPLFHFSDSHQVVFEREAGFLHVEQCVLAQTQRALTAGAEIRIESVVGWESDGDRVRVRTTAGDYEARSLVVTAGAWTRDLLLELKLPLTVKRKLLYWHRTQSPQWGESSAFFFEQADGDFYGFPSRDGRTIKVCQHTGGDVVTDPTFVDRDLSLTDADAVTRFVRQSLSQVEPRPERHSVCLYTMTPDGHFIIDRHPQHANVIIAAGFSGHGFKFTPVIGQALADLATETQTSLPIDFLRLDRPALAAPQDDNRPPPVTIPG